MKKMTKCTWPATQSYSCRKRHRLLKNREHSYFFPQSHCLLPWFVTLPNYSFQGKQNQLLKCTPGPTTWKETNGTLPRVTHDKTEAESKASSQGEPSVPSPSPQPSIRHPIWDHLPQHQFFMHYPIQIFSNSPCLTQPLAHEFYLITFLWRDFEAGDPVATLSGSTTPAFASGYKGYSDTSIWRDQIMEHLDQKYLVVLRYSQQCTGLQKAQCFLPFGLKSQGDILQVKDTGSFYS